MPIQATHISDTTGGEILDILKATSSSFEEWLFTNHIQLYYESNPGSKHNMLFYTLPYTMCPLFIYRRLDETDTIRYTILDYIKKWITEGSYIFLDLNERFIPFSIYCNKEDFYHHQFIYGYSDDDRSIYIRGLNVNRRVIFTTISYDDFCQAVQSRESNSCIELLTVKSEYTYPMDWEHLYHQLNGYTAGYTQTQDDKTICLGSAAEEKLVDILYEIRHGAYWEDIRQIATFKEHILVLPKYMDFFEQNGLALSENLRPSIDALCHLAERCEKMFIKYQLTHDIKILDRLINIIPEILCEEKRIYPIMANAVGGYLQRNALA